MTSLSFFKNVNGKQILYTLRQHYVLSINYNMDCRKGRESILTELKQVLSLFCVCTCREHFIGSPI